MSESKRPAGLPVHRWQSPPPPKPERGSVWSRWWNAYSGNPARASRGWGGPSDDYPKVGHGG